MEYFTGNISFSFLHEHPAMTFYHLDICVVLTELVI